MGDILDTAKSVYRKYKTDGIPATEENDPDKDEIIALFSKVDIAAYAAQAGLATVSDVAARDAFYAVADNQGKLVYVNDNNGESDDPDNGVYEYVDGAPRIAQGFYQGVAAVVQPLVDEATEAAASAVEAAAKIPNEAPVGFAIAFLDGDGDASAGILWDGTARGKAADVDDFVVKTINGSDADSIGAVLEGVVANAPVSYAWALTDGADKAAIGVRDDGTFDAKSAIITELETSSFAAATADFGAITVNGEPITAQLSASEGGNFPYNIDHFLCYGQSGSIGGGTTPPISTIQRYSNLRFAGGTRAQHPDFAGGYYASLVPLIETSSPDGYPGGETPLSGATEMVMELILAEDGLAHTDHSYQLLGSAPGEGGKAIEALMPGSVYFESLKQDIANGYALAQAAGKTYAVLAVSWVHGESNQAVGTIASYKANAIEMLAAINAYAKSITGQTEDVKLIMQQLANPAYAALSAPKIELALFELARDQPNMFLAGTDYIFDFADVAHAVPASQKWRGAYLGLARKRVVNDGIDWKPLMPISHVVQGKIAELKCHVPVKPMVFDTTHVALNTNYGVSLVEANGTPITITSVSLTQPDAIRIVAATTIPAGAKVRFGFSPTTGLGRLTGPRTNIRDSQGDTIVFDGGGLDLPMHNWMPINEYQL